MKEHSSKTEALDKPKGKTLFVENVPPYATKRSLKFAFQQAGAVKTVIFEGETDCFKSAYVVFNKSNDLSKALKLENLKPLSTEAHPISTGISKWVQEYNDSVEDDDALRQRVKSTVNQYDKNEGKTDTVEDDEGWTVVSKKARTPGLSRKESVKSKLSEKNAKKKKQLKNFYTFQIRESKKNHIANLRKKYEEDKKRVEAMKQARKFKPF